MEQLTGMGFTPEQCTLALGVARGSVEGALQILLNPEILELITSGLARRGMGRLGGSRRTRRIACRRIPRWWAGICRWGATSSWRSWSIAASARC